ncbi:Got1 family protein [Sporothrix brasiliensis 5110]|uniref:Got1 family protein n=1 Tax=Sporothrix brasiliensis 5110 TaxID=1398154 RepID=A0A0C2IU55_9PEZI|nr:Got1 family protein [Sporothrix brasiliensis 5110]KIH90305.1 Got1 family protein [Sporothrix brasiliensis 5110]
MPSMWLTDSQKCPGAGAFATRDQKALATPWSRSQAPARAPGAAVAAASAVPDNYANVTLFPNLQKSEWLSAPVILFLIGLTIIIGPAKTLLFFARKQKAKGTAAFFGGLLLILLRWPLIGFCVELYGIMVLFGDFLGTIAAFARNAPVVGPYIGVAVDRAGIGRRNTDLPV